jgi:hypothetical protein
VGKASANLRGRIWIKPFTIKIKSLNSEYEYSEKIVYLDDIRKIVNFMRNQESKGVEGGSI